MTILSPELLQIAEEAKLRFAIGADPKGIGLREWLVRGGSYFVTHSSNKILTLQPTDQTWSTSNGSDVVRYFWAAHESVLPRSAPNYDPRSIGWACITSYYAGFYLILAVLRLFGRGLMYLTADDCIAIGAAAVTANKLDGGTYSVAIKFETTTKLEITKRKSRGFHEAFWAYADDTLKEISDDIGAGVGVSRPFSSSVRAQAILSIETLRQMLGIAGQQDREIGWMSELRNSINYRLSHEVWASNLQPNGVTVDRLRQDVRSIVCGRKASIGRNLIMNQDVRAMIERISRIYGDLSALRNFPKIQ